tara:strand:- start:104 stop:394 length:291 start_codon:yes stop_codon:yes gene_type:complete
MRQAGKQLEQLKSLIKNEGSDVIHLFITHSFGISCMASRSGDTLLLTFDSLKSSFTIYEYLCKYFEYVALEKIIKYEMQETTQREVDCFKITLIIK